VRVYAGIDPVSKKRHDLVETVPAGPSAGSGTGADSTVEPGR
jgi:integrase